jgi:hypothetical protein
MMGTSVRRCAVALVFLQPVTTGAPILAQQSATRPAAPIEPVSAILDAFRTHTVVALGEGPHGNEQGHAFRLLLIRDPRFAANVNDIVVECGNGRYQNVIDQYVRGERVSDEAFRKVFSDSSTQNAVCDHSIYAELVQVVRTVNASNSADFQVRVLLGDPPVDWNRVRTWEDLRKQAGNRNQFVFDLVNREVVQKHRHALIIYGDGHFQARSDRPPRSILARLDSAGVRTLAIASSFADYAGIQPDVASWPVPSMAFIRGTPIGHKPFSFFYGAPPPGAKWPIPLEDHFDAILYLGPRSTMTMSHLPPELCADRAYMDMRTKRIVLGPNGRDDNALYALKLYCAAQQSK